MFTGVTFEQAVKYHLQGKEVIVIDRNSVRPDGKVYDIFPFEELFEGIEFIADVPAVENPEWDKHVAEMVAGNHPDIGEVTVILDEESCGANTTKGQQEDSVEPNDCGGGNTKPEQKSKREIVEEMVLQGLSNREIAEQTGIKYPTVWAYAKEVRDKLPKGQQVLEDNTDRHLCKTCAFRGKNNNSISGTGCEFAVINGHSRGCSVEKCNVYEKGDPKKPKKPLVLA